MLLNTRVRTWLHITAVRGRGQGSTVVLMTSLMGSIEDNGSGVRQTALRAETFKTPVARSGCRARRARTDPLLAHGTAAFDRELTIATRAQGLTAYRMSKTALNMGGKCLSFDLKVGPQKQPV